MYLRVLAHEHVFRHPHPLGSELSAAHLLQLHNHHLLHVVVRPLLKPV